MTYADEGKVQIDQLISLQEQIDRFIENSDEKLASLIQGALALGLQESHDSNMRPVVQMAAQAKSELNLVRSALTEMRGRLLDWRNNRW